MSLISKLAVFSSVLGFAAFSVYFLSGEAPFDAIYGVDDGARSIEAREVNERLYQTPYQVDSSQLVSRSSLQGSDVTTEFKLDEQSNLLADAAVKDLFDYFLSTLGEYELEQVIGSIQATIHKELDEPARSQALDLLKRYIDYKIGIDELQKGFSAHAVTGDIIETLMVQQAEVKAYREQFFDRQEYEAFFNREDVQNTYLIEQIRINQDDSLSAEEKQQLLELAATQLPEDIRETRDRAQKHALLSQNIRQLRMDNASDAEVFHAREQVLGSEAAHALSELDQQRKDWDQRLQAFASERNTVLGSSLSDSDKEESISELLAYHFEGHERKRVSALMSDGRL